MEFRLYPTEEQIDFLESNFGSVRFVYNFYKTYNDFKYKNPCYGNSLVVDITPKLLKDVYDWLKDAWSQSLQRNIKNYWSAVAKYIYLMGKGLIELSGSPNFKSKNGKQSAYLTNQAVKEIDFVKQQIKLPKIGWVKCRNLRKFEGKIISLNVKRIAGKYYEVITHKAMILPKKKTGKTVGLDLGIKDTVVSSDSFKSGKIELKKLDERISKLNKIYNSKD